MARLGSACRQWPRLVAEYKPAFGTIFSEYLANYTHWGYSDVDIVMGHMVRFLERSELIDHHIVTCEEAATRPSSPPILYIDSTRLDSTRLDSARLDSARLDSTGHDSARHDSARHDTTRLHSTRLGSARVDFPSARLCPPPPTGVSDSFGDSDAIYLRGQWAIHQNLPNVNSIWLGCEHLGRGLQQELHQKVAWVQRNEAAGRSHYHKRFLSAEGCYSYRAFHTKGIKIKVPT